MGEMSREALEAYAEGLRAALVDAGRENGRLIAEAAAAESDADETTAAHDEVARLTALVEDVDARIARAKAEAEARAAKDREHAQMSIDRALRAESKATESQQAKARAEAAAAEAERELAQTAEAYGVVRSQRDWAYQRIQDLREALTAAGVAVPAERPLGKL